MKRNKNDLRTVHRSLNTSLNQSLDVSIQMEEEIKGDKNEGAILANIMVPEKNEIPLPSTGTMIKTEKPKYVSIKRRPGFQSTYELIIKQKFCISEQRLKKVLTTPIKRKKFENGWNQYCFDVKYCNRWTFIALLAGSFFIGNIGDKLVTP